MTLALSNEGVTDPSLAATVDTLLTEALYVATFDPPTGTLEALLNSGELELLGRTAVTHAQAGADLIAPSAMMDGQVWAIRQALNDNGYTDTPIMGYAAKYASAFYGPFRVAAGSTPQFGDRRSYQMDPANARMAMREISSDIAEGADIIMVKPALSYLAAGQTWPAQPPRESGLG